MTELKKKSSGVLNADGFTEAQLKALKEEARLSFMSFWNEAQTDKNSPGYGLVYDKYPSKKNIASTASMGFFLASLTGAVEDGWVSKEEAEERALLTLKNVLRLEHIHGFLYHFISMDTGIHYDNCEISVIDTALLVAGAITAGEYFKGEVKKTADEIYSRINWNFYTFNEDDGRLKYRMGFNPHTAVKNGKYIYSFNSPKGFVHAGDPAEGKKESDGFSGAWNGASEQLCMYVLGAGAPNESNRIPKKMFYDIKRPKGSYKGAEEFIYSWVGALFVYQFSHAFVDFRNIVDEEGVDWFENSIKATLNAKLYATDLEGRLPTYGKNAWGMTACETPKGYRGNLGSQPSEMNGEEFLEGTVPPCGALGSMPFAPKEVMEAFEHYMSIDGLCGEYGLLDSYNMSNGKKWICKNIIGIDKGITAVMLMNYLFDGIVWKYFMKNEFVQAGIRNLGFKTKNQSKKA